MPRLDINQCPDRPSLPAPMVHLQPKDTYTQLFSELRLGLPLFSPSNVQLGDVGYISRGDGSFQLLYNIATPDMNIEGSSTRNSPGTKPDLTEWQAIHVCSCFLRFILSGLLYSTFSLQMRAKSSGKVDVYVLARFRYFHG